MSDYYGVTGCNRFVALRDKTSESRYSYGTHPSHLNAAVTYLFCTCSKTTLLDVLAGRKNSGVMKGSITLNGHPKEPLSFARLTAYVEQQDIHSSFATVRESLEFSAALRLPSSVPAATRRAFVSEVLDLLELRPIADRKVGDVGAADGLSPGQRKILTIAVELCANAPILFLDE